MKRMILFFTLLNSILSSQMSLAAPQERDESSVGPESGAQKAENVDLEGPDRTQLEKELHGSTVRLRWGVALTSIGLATGVNINIGEKFTIGIDGGARRWDYRYFSANPIQAQSLRVRC